MNQKEIFEVDFFNAQLSKKVFEPYSINLKSLPQFFPYPPRKGCFLEL